MQVLGTLICRASILISVITLSSPLMAEPQTGIASVYSNEKTANGEYAYPSRFTAAHRTLPFGTFVEVTNAQDRALRDRPHQRPRPLYRGADHRPHPGRGRGDRLRRSRAGHRDGAGHHRVRPFRPTQRLKPQRVARATADDAGPAPAPKEKPLRNAGACTQQSGAVASELAVAPQNLAAWLADAMADRSQCRPAAQDIAHAHRAVGVVAVSCRGGLARRQILDVEGAGRADRSTKAKNSKKAFHHHQVPVFVG